VDWVKLAVDYFDDERIEEDAAEVMFTCGGGGAGAGGREVRHPTRALLLLDETGSCRVCTTTLTD
jgi:hypothetical protein